MEQSLTLFPRIFASLARCPSWRGAVRARCPRQVGCIVCLLGHQHSQLEHRNCLFFPLLSRRESGSQSSSQGDGLVAHFVPAIPKGGVGAERNITACLNTPGPEARPDPKTCAASGRGAGASHTCPLPPRTPRGSVPRTCQRSTSRGKTEASSWGAVFYVWFKGFKNFQKPMRGWTPS